jgi:hypothetical protein
LIPATAASTGGLPLAISSTAIFTAFLALPLPMAVGVTARRFGGTWKVGAPSPVVTAAICVHPEDASSGEAEAAAE